MEKEYYLELKHRADHCVDCGKCEPNCPFGVKIVERMKRIVEVMMD
ncbi:MAG: 4Fe-4S binding protein [Clostridia bacterium]|nr:4Fe-4S binding protein [Clostridia bacterium]